MAYDPIRRVVVMFGGATGPNFATQGDTWVWDGADWRVAPGAGPLPRAHFQMAFDYVRGNVVMFGGEDTSYAIFRDMWEWDGGAWRQIPLAGSPVPPGRVGGAMASDPTRMKIVLFGGLGAVSGTPSPWRQRLNDTWEWDGSRWTEHSPATTPIASIHSGAAWNPRTGRVTVIGGHNGGSCVSGAVVHEWDGLNWVRIQAGGAVPLEICSNVITDPLGRGLLGVWGASLSLFDGSSWRALPAPTPGTALGPVVEDCARGVLMSVLARGDVNMSFHDGAQSSWSHATILSGPTFFRAGYDSARRRLVFGVNHAWSDEGWEDLSHVQAPYEHSYGAIAAHPSTGHLVYISPSALAARETWVHDGHVWRREPFVTGPSDSSGGEFVPDPANDRLLLWIGQTLWEWTPANQWRSIATSPSGVFLGALALDAGRQRFVGYSLTAGNAVQTWEWDDSSWAMVTTATRPPVHAITYAVYAPSFGGILTFGRSPNDDGMVVWCYDGTDWRPVAVRGTTPPYRLQDPMPTSLVYDASRRRVIAAFSPNWSGSTTHLFELVHEHLAADQDIVPVGASVTFRAEFPGSANLPWMLLLAWSDHGGLVLGPSSYVGAEVFPLDPDPLLLASLEAWMGGLLDFRGRGSFTFPVPAMSALKGLRFHAAALTIGPQLSLDEISNPVPVQIAW